MDLNIGISNDDRHRIAAGLSRLLADTYTLYLKTHTPLERRGAAVQHAAPDV